MACDVGGSAWEEGELFNAGKRTEDVACEVVAVVFTAGVSVVKDGTGEN